MYFKNLISYEVFIMSDLISENAMIIVLLITYYLLIAHNNMKNKLSSFFWFDNDLREVITYYQDIFNNNGENNFEEISHKILSGDGTDKIELASVNIFGNTYHLMNARRMVSFNDSMSLMISTDDQTETDYYWDKFTKEGSENVCGWCKDKYGISWQVTPKRLMELNASSDPEISGYSMQQMMQMKKIIIKDLEK